MENIEAYYIDFDKLFENFADKYYSDHEGEYDTPDDFVRDIDKVYHIWSTSAQEPLGGLTPSEFFARIPTDSLIEILKGACVGDNNPSSLLFDRIASEPSLLPDLVALARSSADEKLLSVTLGIIAELGGADDSFYMDMLERDIDDHVKEHCLEALCDHAEAIKPELLRRANAAADIKLKEMYAEALSCCEPGDDGILALLRELLSSDDNTAYIAELMGRYGDERAASDLYKLLDSCDYAVFIEVRNAIEELGGSVDANYRDFSDDPMYKLLK